AQFLFNTVEISSSADVALGGHPCVSTTLRSPIFPHQVDRGWRVQLRHRGGGVFVRSSSKTSLIGASECGSKMPGVGRASIARPNRSQLDFRASELLFFSRSKIDLASCPSGLSRFIDARSKSSPRRL